MALRSAQHITSLTELRRTGQGQLDATPVRFQWDPGTHTSPRADIDLSIAVKTVRQEHAGTDRPVEQVLSVSWQPFQITGEWRDTYAGQGFAKDTFREFQRLVARGSLVRIEIDDPEILSFTGLIHSLRITYQRAQHIGYEVTFSPHYSGDGGDLRTQSIVPPAARTRASILDGAAELAQAMADGIASIQPVQTATAVRENAATIVSTLQGRIDDARVLVEAGESAVEQASAELAAYQAIQGDCQNLLDEVGDVSAGGAAAARDAISLIRLDLWLRETGAYARQTVLLANDGQESASARAALTSERTYRPGSDESVYQVAARFYGDPADWRRIVEANPGTGIRFDGTELLVIPGAGA